MASCSKRILSTLVLCSVVLVTFGDPVLFPDDPEYPSYKDRTTSTTRAPVVVRNPRLQKNRWSGGGRSGEQRSSRLDPNRKKQLTDFTPSHRDPRVHRYDQRGDRRNSAPPLPAGGARGRRPSADLGAASNEVSIVTTKDGYPVVMELDGGVSRRCPKPTGRFPIMRHCDKYLDCSYNTGYVRSCAPGTMFEYRSGRCNFPYRVQCIDDFELYEGEEVDLAAAASTRPPLTPSVMEIPTALINPDGSVSTECPEPTGMFAVPGRCDEFLNCWKGRGYVQKCAPGTLFHCHSEKCDFPHKVRCVQKDKPQAPMIDISEFARINPLGSNTITARSRFGQVMAPPSGQRIRLRDGRSITQGHVQLYHEGQWNYVCEDDFTRHLADTVCWDLGFTRGSKEMIMKTSLYFKQNLQTRLLSLRCQGDVSHIHECDKRARDTCKVVGIKCEENSMSACPTGYKKFEDHCYKVYPVDPKSREDAKRVCESDGAHLLTVHSQAENNFVSELLQYLPNIGCLHTAGVGMNFFSRALWIWETTTEPLEFEKWWPGWNRQSEGEAPNPGNSAKCLVLQNIFPSPPLAARSSRTQLEITRNIDSGYFWWTSAECTEKLPFICKTQTAEIGCIRRDGSDYEGEASTAQGGQPCLKWTDLRIRDLTSQLALNTNQIGDHNYCRNPDNDNRPWCFISARDYDYCDIPRCQNQEESEVMTSVRHDVMTSQSDCGENMFQCRPGECKYFSWVCDGEEDCSNGKDESDCHDHLQDYKVTNHVKLVGYDVEKWLYTDKATCARRCSETKDFLCRAFNYKSEDQTCFLLDSNIALSGAAERDRQFDLYEHVSEIPDCSRKHVCPSGMCLNRTQVCDGRRDCPDGSEEKECLSKIDFQIRLVDGSAPNEGRIEVRAFGRWGVVCDDLFTVVDGDVICRHLGYRLGAAEVVTNAGFGSGHGHFLIDDLNCRGDEEKVTECDFAGWGRSDCTEAEVAGVKCRVQGEPCTEKQWQCNNGKCIDLAYVCDRVDDCGDFSDEADSLCKQPLQARLVGGTNTSGRVEIRYKGVWGTVCDDDFESEDAQVVCRMLGYEGSAVVHKLPEFGAGSGQIWLDQVNCGGKEKSIDECFHLPWGQSNCAHEEDVGISCHASATRRIGVTSTRLTPAGLLPDMCGKRYAPDTPVIPTDQNAKIVAGKTTEPGAHPWMVGVRIKAGADTAHWCGAVVISEFHILSAAHCLLDYPQEVYVLRVGDYDNQVVDAEEQEFTIERMYPHPEFNKGSYLNNDIIIIRVKSVHGRGIRFGRMVQPVCLSPPDLEYHPYKNCTISGWGSTGRRAGYARRLQSAVLPLLPISTCTAKHVYGKDKITEGMYCAGYLEGGIDTCQGDSGGPMVCQQDGSNVLYGITSWGQGCARPNKPGVYTKITSYLNWIYRTLEEDSNL